MRESVITRRELGRAAAGALLAAGNWPREAQGELPVAVDIGAAAWRANFPALTQRVNGRSLVYLDSAATTQRPQAVIDALVNFYRHDNANPGVSLHTLARRAHELYEGARRTVAKSSLRAATSNCAFKPSSEVVCAKARDSMTLKTGNRNKPSEPANTNPASSSTRNDFVIKAR